MFGVIQLSRRRFRWDGGYTQSCKWIAFTVCTMQQYLFCLNRLKTSMRVLLNVCYSPYLAKKYYSPTFKTFAKLISHNDRILVRKCWQFWIVMFIDFVLTDLDDYMVPKLMILKLKSWTVKSSCFGLLSSFYDHIIIISPSI